MLAKPSTPFWAKAGKLSRGRDPLGIQNSSVAVYSRLLEGLTNVTTKIRYYGFYCWLLEQYQKLDWLRENDITKQVWFIRRAELTLAFANIINDPEANGVGGSYFVRRQLLRGGGPCNIAEGADYNATKRYWQLELGVFGQYYVGVLQHFKLISAPDKEEVSIYLRTPSRGEELANAFGDNIRSCQDLFLKIVKNGVLNQRDATKLLSFQLDVVPENSREWVLYNELMFGIDNPARVRASHQHLRRDTISLLLDYYRRNPGGNYRDFLSGLMNTKRSGEPPAAQLWLYYALNDIFHFGYETVFCAILQKVGETPFISIEEFLNEMLDTVSIGTEVTVEEWLALLPIAWRPTYEEMQTTYKSGYYITAIEEATKLLGILYKKFRDQAKELFDLSFKLGMDRPGNVQDLMIEFFEQGGSKYHNLLTHVCYCCLNDHSLSSFRKVRLDQAQVLALVVEEGYLKYLRPVDPSLTGPRLLNLENFLINLGYITSDRKVSPTGLEKLKEL